ncbi:radical SAM protein [Candidatus Omnitrophota bacterium]
MKSRSYNTFRKRIHQSAATQGFPVRVMFELTYRCNFRCAHCYIPLSYRRKAELSTSEVFSILDQLKEIGCFYLGFTGGEPFIREDILDILWYAKKNGFAIIIYSNGSLIDKGVVSELARLRPNKVDITIPAMSKRAWERITRLPGSHRKVFRAVDLLRNKGINLGLKTCILKKNESEIKAIADFAAGLGVGYRLDDMLFPRLDGSREPSKHQGDRISDRVATQGVPPKAGNPNAGTLFKCGVGASQMAISPRGELKMCLMIDYPKFKIWTAQRNQRTGLKTAWAGLKELAASIKPDENYQCAKCELEPLCRWCPARSWLISGHKSFTSCDPQSRKRAQAGHRIT